MTPMPMKSSSVTIFTPTMIELTVALSLAPRIRKTIESRTTISAGRLMNPPSPSGAETDPGMVMPTVPSRSSLRYWPQPTATAATETAYSRTRHQPQIQAMNSPMVAYA